ncbi:delta subunit of the central stalk of mitochondrial F1F0 ATP synthase, atp16 [Tulasnella sp. 424]|nr:delta subunit of the central stalk of mitochondrial F1F0 ATP synthase, atp16 [Tulasnella sp. 424]KAG8967467.1 delta subunit of the central stalk of mitochondrial F1F0 ATP synthase, atp16 [Tulasnella sp. 425]
MAALRSIASSVAFAAVRRTPTAVTLGRRGYAEAADKIKLSLVLPHQALYASQDVVQVNISAATGDMGILANHAPSIEPLRAGLLEVIESAGTSKKFFVSGGFATVHPNNALTINAVEGAPLEDFSAEAVRTNLADVQRVLAGNGSEAEKAEARIEADVYESLQYALGTK